MKVNERQNFVRQRKNRREKQIKIFITIAGIAVVLLFIYLVWAVFSLLINSIGVHSGTESRTNVSVERGDAYDYGMETNRYEISAETKLEMEETYRKIFEDSTMLVSDKVMEEVISFALENNIAIKEYPVKLLELLQKNPETKEFVLNYSLKKGEGCQLFVRRCRFDTIIHGRLFHKKWLLCRRGWFILGTNV